MTAFRILPCGPLETNALFLWEREDSEKRALLVDPGANAPALIQMAAQEGLKVVAMLLTHGHLDHCGALDACRAHWPVPVYMHPEDRFLLRTGVNLELARMLGVPVPQAPENPLFEGQNLRLGALDLTVLHTPGHSPGSICLLLPGLLVSGDTLFAGGMGRTDLPGGDEGLMARSLLRLGRLAPEIRVIPGHGPCTTIGEEWAQNPYLGNH